MRRFIIATLRFVVVSPSVNRRGRIRVPLVAALLCPAPASESATRVFMSVPGTTGWLYLEDVVKHNKWVERFFVLDEGHLRYFLNDSDLDPVATINVRGIEATSVARARVGKHAFRLNVTRQADGRYK